MPRRDSGLVRNPDAPVPREIINTWDQTKRGWSIAGVYISPSRMPGRDSSVHGYSVIRMDECGREIPTDRSAAWYHHGRKHFSASQGGFHDRQRAALALAQAWVAEQGWYAGPWKRNRMGDYVPEEVNKLYPLRKL